MGHDKKDSQVVAEELVTPSSGAAKLRSETSIRGCHMSAAVDWSIVKFRDSQILTATVPEPA